MNNDRRPTFFILGAAKAGTTSLYAHMRKHPNIYLPSIKEPHFFDNDVKYSLGLQFYLDSYFTGAENYPVRGEATPAYFHLADKVAPRILQIYPDFHPKFIVILRDPVQRAWSHYLHSLRQGVIEESFEQALEMEPFRLADDAIKWQGYYSDGLYARQIRQWFKYFDKERFFFLLSDDLRNNPLSTVNHAYRFLGVIEKEEVDEPILENVASKPLNLALMKFITRPSILKKPFKRIIPLHKQKPLKDFLQKIIVRPYRVFPKMNPETATLLREKYTDDIRVLETIINRDLSKWLNTRDKEIIRICHIVPDYYPLRNPAIVYTRALADAGHKVDVLSLYRGEEPHLEFSHGIRILRLTKLQKEFFFIKITPFFIKEVQRVLAKNEYDLIHIYSFRGCFLLPLINRKRDFRWILNIQTGNVTAKRRLSNFANWITKIECRAFNEIMVIDSMIAEKVLSRNTPFTEIPLGADFGKFQPARNPNLRQSLGIGENELAVVYSGSLEPQRHTEVILEAFKLAVLKVPQLKLLIIGDGTCRLMLEELAKEKGIEKQVIFTGFVSYDDMPNYVSSSDIGLGYVPVNPQYDSQPPLKTVEYLACGLPTVATRTKGNMRFVQQGVNGLLCDDDPRSIADKIVCLVIEPIFREQLASRARSSVERYDWNYIVNDMLIPYYRKVLENHRSIDTT